ncbi:shieldin complex subunit 1 isoform X2 [Tupaia chinensis]|uniref:shieldin complex subunit 1 isoform X2 n=1 Tax=Tupaia chinensis TaxID=246437 RepID=UPI000FFC7D40|nr:shieldin complex subunit 1 isoform X2 [Tupaia chinensis]
MDYCSTMATQENTPGSQSEESNVLDLPSTNDIRDYVLQRPSQEPNSEAFSSVEFLSFPCSSDVDPGGKTSYLSRAVGRDFKGQPPGLTTSGCFLKVFKLRAFSDLHPNAFRHRRTLSSTGENGIVYCFI